MKDLFGTDGIVNHVTLIFVAVYVLGAMIFRKSIANDVLGMGFSVIGSSGCAILSFIIMDNIFNVLRFSVGLSLIAFFIGGFLLWGIIGDGESGGNA